MKLHYILFLSVCSLASNALSSDRSVLVSELFNRSEIFQKELNEVGQIDFNYIRLSKKINKHSLRELQFFADNITSAEEILLSGFPTQLNSCLNNLLALVDLLTTFSGYSSANCMRAFHNNIGNELDNIIFHESYLNRLHRELQVLSVRLFGEKNMFTENQEIIDHLEKHSDDLKLLHFNTTSLRQLIRTFENVTIPNEKTKLTQCLQVVELSLTRNFDDVKNQILGCVSVR